jgi:hypothetical protein
MESDKTDGEIFLFTSESVGEGHPGEWCNILRGNENVFLQNRMKLSIKLKWKIVLIKESNRTVSFYDLKINKNESFLFLFEISIY